MTSNGGSRAAVIAGYVRSPIGRYGGVLADVRPDTLAATTIRALLERTGVDPAEVDDVILGCANQAGEDNRNVARMALLLAGLPETVPGATLNRLCASGLDAVHGHFRAADHGVLVDIGQVEAKPFPISRCLGKIRDGEVVGMAPGDVRGRVLVQEDVADGMIRMIAGAMEALKVGDPSDLATDVGPVIDEDAKRLLDEHLAERADHGHRLWTLVMLELWQRTHVEAAAALATPVASP